MSKFVTFPVAAAAYPRAGKIDFSTLTHVVEVDPDGKLVRVLCRRVKLASILDDYEMATDGAPTCPDCLRRWTKLQAGGIK